MAYTIINKSSDYFNTKLYTGNGGTQSIDVGFQSDFTWLKSRTEAKNHVLIDAVRGSSKNIHSNLTNAEDTNATRITGFDSDGFNLGSSSTTNTNSQNYVSWNWKANGAGSANTDGDLNSTVSVNTTAGFSIVTYSGTGNFGESVGHGLGVAPSMIIARRLNGVEDWGVYHKALGASKYIILNTTGAEQSSTSRWGGVAPTNSVFTVGNHASVNVGSGTHVAYCFADVQGYSKFSSYTGNGNADGTFVYTGFAPAFIIYKHTTDGHSWIMEDVKRNIAGNGYLNGSASREFYPNANNAEGTAGQRFDFLSNGFKIRETSADINQSGSKFIYMAFAEAPLVGSNNTPCTAR